ncbi:MAG: type II toxin-antitoxin system MqsR family toxin [Hydrogenophaga sp.]|nr:type II toxin-antitoxin system MqsR family toxin [Hydrogenophaga sp.]
MHRSRPAGCGQGNPAVGGSRSYRLRLSEHLGTELRRQVAGCQQIQYKVWQDVYRTSTPAGDLYLKLTVIDDVLIVSYKEL